MAQKKKKINVMSPVGTLIYPHLLVADKYKGKEAYKAKLRLSPAAAKPMIDLIEDSLDKELKKQRVVRDEPELEFTDTYKPWKVEDNGDYTFTFKTNRFGKDKNGDTFENRVAVFDGTGAVITDRTLKIHTGSEGSLKGALNLWCMENDEGGETLGCSLRVEGAQIIKLADEAEPDANSYGFSAVEGGFDASAPVATDSDGEAVAAEREEY